MFLHLILGLGMLKNFLVDKTASPLYAISAFRNLCFQVAGKPIIKVQE